MSTTLSQNLPGTPSILSAERAPVFAPILGALRKAGISVWRGLETLGYLRARREMLSLARQYQSTRPELAARLREAALNAPQR